MPMPQTKWVIFPSVSFQISGPVRAIVRFRIHRVFVLIGIKGIGNFAREFCGDGIVAARIFGFDGGGADDHFGAEGFEQIDFFARLFVGDGEDDFVAAHAGDERQAQAGVAGSAFDDRAAGLEFAGAFGFFDHGRCRCGLSPSRRDSGNRL